jgi:hypothetical protein
MIFDHLLSYSVRGRLGANVQSTKLIAPEVDDRRPRSICIRNIPSKPTGQFTDIPPLSMFVVLDHLNAMTPAQGSEIGSLPANEKLVRSLVTYQLLEG